MVVLNCLLNMFSFSSILRVRVRDFTRGCKHKPQLKACSWCWRVFGSIFFSFGRLPRTYARAAILTQWRSLHQARTLLVTRVIELTWRVQCSHVTGFRTYTRLSPLSMGITSRWANVKSGGSMQHILRWAVRNIVSISRPCGCPVRWETGLGSAST